MGQTHVGVIAIKLFLMPKPEQDVIDGHVSRKKESFNQRASGLPERASQNPTEISNLRLLIEKQMIAM